MKIVYTSSACSKLRFLEAFPDVKNMPGQQAQKYNRLMLEGLARNNIHVIALTSPPITRSNYRHIAARIRPDTANGVAYHYLPIINFPVIKNVIVFVTSFARTLGLLYNNRDAVVIGDVLNFSASTGALLAAKLIRRSNTGIVTDIPRLLSNGPNRFVTWLTTFVLMHYDSYVFLTEQMNDLVNRRNVPFVVLEGQVDVDMVKRQNDFVSKHPQLVCLYAGATDRKYGIDNLVEGFRASHTPGSELRIYGRGDYEETLAEIAREDQRVKYFGTVPNDLVVEEQLRATLLVNPRPTTEEFTMYSFPSKNMEYMASGTPVLTTRLPGMPDEYLPHVYVLSDETPAGVSAALDTILAIDAEELHRKGREAKDFVLQTKNNTIQAKRVLQLIGRSANGLHRSDARPPSEPLRADPAS